VGTDSYREPVRIDVWSDVVCPWCYLGKRRLERALAGFEHRDAVEVHWRSFELDPNAPAVREGDPAGRLARKYGISVEEARTASERLTALAARSGNSFNAHRLLHLAEGHGVQDQLKERLLAAYLCEGQAIGDPNVLLAQATTAGLDPAEVREVLETDAYAEDVRADEAEAAELEINGVPFFLLGGRFGIPGAQEVDTMVAVLERAWQKLEAGAAGPA
jgi:predicted DsbA family dithiol-disulfide isomerase